ncbi:MAG: hypothetical protein Q9160_000456 [Pyrenula sp. 1 TL-2023]
MAENNSEAKAAGPYTASFWNYPSPREGPAVPYTNDATSNPVLRGVTLAIATTIIRSVTFVQSILWKNAQFDTLRNIPELKGYDPRYDPTVIPIASQSKALQDPLKSELLTCQPRKTSKGYYTSGDFHAAYKAGQLTPTAVAEALLPLIQRDALSPGKHSVAFLEVKREILIKAAEASTQRYKVGKPLSVLDGVPVAVKDEAEIKDYKRTLASNNDFTGKLNETAWCVRKWEEAGAMIIGKSTMHEIGLDTTNNNPIFGTPRNPHNEHFYTGGSSGGSAYATAAGLCPLSLGADGGGSIRIPASFCGLYGLKTSHGRVSGAPTNDICRTTGVYGPIASSIDDLAIAYRVMAQQDLNTHSAKFPDPLTLDSARNQSLNGHVKYLGVCEEWIARADPAVKSFFDKAIDFYIHKRGYKRVSIRIPFLPQLQKAHALTILSEIRSGLQPDQISHLTHHNQLLMSVAGTHSTAQDLIAAQRLRSLLMSHLASLWDKYPEMLIVTPTTPLPGWRINDGDLARGLSDSDTSLKNMEYVFMANFSGNPAISVPMGYTEVDGHGKEASGNSGSYIPAGLMAMGIWGSEEQLIEWAKEGEELLAGGEEAAIRRPEGEGWVDVLEIANKGK